MPAAASHLKASNPDICDQCRARKVKCIPLDEPVPSPSESRGSLARRGQCLSCQRRGRTCTFDYVFGKPGRPKGTIQSRPSPGPKRRQSKEVTGSRPRSSRTEEYNQELPPPSQPSLDTLTFTSPIDVESSSTNFGDEHTSSQAIFVQSNSAPPQLNISPSEAHTTRDTITPSSLYGPALGSIFGSARIALDYPSSDIFNYNIPLQDHQAIQQALPQEPDDSPGDFVNDITRYNTQSTVPLLPRALSPASRTQDPLEANLTARSDHQDSTFTSDVIDGLPNLVPAIPTAQHPAFTLDRSRPFLQISAFATWEQVGFFLSLHMKHQHVLVPLVHQPNFARDLLHRRDQHDETFRGLLLSFVAYTICQCPIHLLLAHSSRTELESLLRRCQEASRAIQIRNQLRPSPILLASTILDWITSQAFGRESLRENLMSDVRRMVYSLRLHHANPKENTSLIDVEIGRRLFWEAYAIDKTNAMNGHPMCLHDSDGIPPLPLELDDEYITARGTIPTVRHDLSFMAGFIAVSRIFSLLSQSITYQRILRERISPSPDRVAITSWVEEARHQVRTLLEDLPPDLRGAGQHNQHSIYGTQQANIHITALCLELSLLDLQTTVAPGEDVTADRKYITEKAFQQLSGIPVECLASNGESMRGKVLRVVLSLLGSGGEEASETQQLSNGLWDWWNMDCPLKVLKRSILPGNSRPFFGGGHQTILAASAMKIAKLHKMTRMCG